ncbi:hypothetical protein [Georgenia sp. SUBG003]|uniref:hypothetical protein n=1 Tax=Georgenia sp. SUBG003 TaxID=1497974 RepID=UPI003AB62F7D
MSHISPEFARTIHEERLAEAEHLRQLRHLPEGQVAGRSLPAGARRLARRHRLDRGAR